MELYHPIEVLKPIAPDLWVVDGPIVKMAFAWLRVPFPTRMVVARLADGGLFLWSPTAATPALLGAVAALGPVRHLIAPNKLHYAHIAAWKSAYPGAIAWASPGVRERAAAQGIEVRFDAELGEGPDPAWAADIDQVIMHGSRYLDEVVFFHRGSRTLILADLIENFESAKLGRGSRIIARLGGVLDPDGKAPADLRATFTGAARRAEARAALATMLAWAPERVVMAHGRIYERDGVAELRRAFRWLAPLPG